MQEWRQVSTTDRVTDSVTGVVEREKRAKPVEMGWKNMEQMITSVKCVYETESPSLYF